MNEITISLEAADYRCIKLNVTFAFHSKQTDSILKDFEIISKTIIFQEPKLPVISSLLGKIVFDRKTLNANYIRRAIREAIDFLSTLKNAQKITIISDKTVWIEIEPHPVCTNFVKSLIPFTELAIPSIRRDDNN